jgi:hypothetical protein
MLFSQHIIRYSIFVLDEWPEGKAIVQQVFRVNTFLQPGEIKKPTGMSWKISLMLYL